MNRKEQLLTILSEECAEVAKEVSKALRFGLDDWAPGKTQNETNRKKITDELNDLIGVAFMLLDEGYIDDFIIPEKIENKQNKVEYYLEISKKLGTLHD